MAIWNNSAAVMNITKNRFAGFGAAQSAMAAAGSGNTLYLTACETFNGSVYTNIANCNTARFQTAGAGTMSAGMMTCGTVSGGATASTELYNSTSWAVSGSMLTSTQVLACGGTQTAGFITGGDATLSNYYTFNSSTWSSSTAMPGGQCRHGVSGTQTSILSFCGEASNLDTTFIGTTYSYNGTAWSTGGSTLTARRNVGGCGTSNASAMVFGGDTTAATVSPTVAAETYNGTAWSAVGSMNVARSHLNGSAFGSATAGWGNYIATMSGGFIGGGAGTVAQKHVFLMLGGFIAGGSAAIRIPQYRTSMSGGFIAGGAAVERLNAYRTAMSGGFIVGGTMPASFQSITLQDITWSIWDGNNNPITGGAASTTLKIRQVNTNNFFDFSTMTFMASGWTSLTATLLEVDPVNLAGYYHRSVNVSNWLDGWYQAMTRYTGTPAQNGDIEFFLKNGIIMEYRVGANLDAQVGFLQKIVKNKKILQKTGATWRLIQYDNDGVTQIINKALKDAAGNDITDLVAGVLAQELASSV